MLLAYLIIVHKNFGQIKRLIRNLEDHEAKIYIVIDEKSHDLREEIEKFQKEEGLIEIVEKTYPITWGGFNMVRATISGIEYILNSEERFRYLVLLSGQDFPIKNKNEIKNFFRKSDREFITNFEIPNEIWEGENGGFNRVDYYYNYDDSELWRYEYREIMEEHNFTNPRMEKVKLYGGSQWWCLTYECLEYIKEFTQKEYEFINYFKYSEIPDELFFQTIIMNSPFRDNVENDFKRYVDWKPQSPHPETLTIKDYGKISDSKAFWARKFDEDIDSDVIDKIEAELL